MTESFVLPFLGEYWTASLALMAGLAMVASLAFIPRPPICLAAGLMFGLVAFPVVLAGTTCGAVIAFLLARYLFRSRVARIAGRHARLKLVMDAIDAEGWRLLGLLRLASPVPGSAANYFFGLTQIGLGPYAAATALGSAPRVLAFVYFGAAARVALDAQSVSSVKLAFTLLGCTLFACTILLVGRRVKAILAVRVAARADDPR